MCQKMNYTSSQEIRQQMLRSNVNVAHIALRAHKEFSDYDQRHDIISFFENHIDRDNTTALQKCMFLVVYEQLLYQAEKHTRRALAQKLIFETIIKKMCKNKSLDVSSSIDMKTLKHSYAESPWADLESLRALNIIKIQKIRNLSKNAARIYDQDENFNFKKQHKEKKEDDEEEEDWCLLDKSLYVTHEHDCSSNKNHRQSTSSIYSTSNTTTNAAYSQRCDVDLHLFVLKLKYSLNEYIENRKLTNLLLHKEEALDIKIIGATDARSHVEYIKALLEIFINANSYLERYNDLNDSQDPTDVPLIVADETSLVIDSNNNTFNTSAILQSSFHNFKMKINSLDVDSKSILSNTTNKITKMKKEEEFNTFQNLFTQQTYNSI